MNKVIILTRMYVGSYLQDNIGHEAINLFKDDNGNNYIYIGHDGKVNPKYNDSVRAVLLVRYEEPDVMEVIAKAEELEQILYKTGDINQEADSQIAYVNNNNVTYGGIRLHRLHGSGKAEKLSISFKVNKLRKAKVPLYLTEDPQKVSAYVNCFILPEKHFSRQSLKMYYDEQLLPGDYCALENIIDDDALWEEENTTEKISISEQRSNYHQDSFLSIIRKEYDELVFSNLLAHFFAENRSLFVKFAKEVLGVNDFSSDFEIIRESKDRIDLWIEDENNVLVIENKIKSKINGQWRNTNSDVYSSQLKKYYEFVHKERPNKEIHCFIFAPDYNPIDLSKYEKGECYAIIKYSQIHEFYLKYAGQMLRSKYFVDFVDALKLHTKTIDNSNYEIMKNRFISKINRIIESDRTLSYSQLE